MSAAAQTTWCRQIADALARSGVEMVAISPGSRSAPLALALIEESRLTTEVIVDERAAAFFALGAARETGKPAAAVCTSGSAGAHYHPAVIEAERAGIPLLLLTADRPPERHHRQAPQTTEQVGFYGAHCRGSFDLGPAEAAARMLTATARTVALAVGRARGTRGSTPGPVQINLRLRKPLEPDPQAPPIVEASLPTVHRPDSVPAAASLEALTEICRSRSRGLIIAGPAHPWTAVDPTVLARFARRTGMPVVAEAASQLRFAPRPLACHRCESWEWLLRCDRLKDLGPPDLLLHFGPPSTPSGAGTLSEAFPDATLAVVHPGAEGDPADRSALIVPAEAKPTLEGLLERIGDGPGSHEDWGRRIGALDTAAWLEIESALARESDFIEAIAVRTVLENLPGGALLALANSLPIREVDLFCPGAMARVPVLHQRGAHGIDGMVAGAAGA
ncbi:MAG TPA: 2-succinyl-5-enolpyruvyl-6-hydroxy-3-cyclohexene-1-carboxylic-acid synthase, partial [Acidobacteria bacterium]|nr:2-succinyl-5-enolpyruvyl-6-hydroxy-3-cyclohexene-1-carboxylic-acid synthase [Acidobacteriota bacterium]